MCEFLSTILFSILENINLHNFNLTKNPEKTLCVDQKTVTVFDGYDKLIEMNQIDPNITNLI